MGTLSATAHKTTITEGASMDLDALGVAYSNVNIRAEIGTQAVGPTTFALPGAQFRNQTEGVGRYYLAGDPFGVAHDYSVAPGSLTPRRHPMVHWWRRWCRGEQPHGPLHRRDHELPIGCTTQPQNQKGAGFAAAAILCPVNLTWFVDPEMHCHFLVACSSGLGYPMG